MTPCPLWRVRGVRVTPREGKEIQKKTGGSKRDGGVLKGGKKEKRNLARTPQSAFPHENFYTTGRSERKGREKRRESNGLS